MLEYEKKLHLDKLYNKMHESNWGAIILTSVWCVICYIVAFYFLHWVGRYIPDIYAWSFSADWLQIGDVTFQQVDGIYFVVGTVMMLYGSVRLAVITKENHSVREKDKTQPDKLLTEGSYAKVRHPMYGTFAIMYGAIFFSTHSIDGIGVVLLIVLGQYANAAAEEKWGLRPLFGEEYRAYKEKVRSSILTSWQKMIFLLCILITVLGCLW